jgi:hypothetical protein
MVPFGSTTFLRVFMGQTSIDRPLILGLVRRRFLEGRPNGILF